jgi:hypothetical protein
VHERGCRACASPHHRGGSITAVTEAAARAGRSSTHEEADGAPQTASKAAGAQEQEIRGWQCEPSLRASQGSTSCCKIPRTVRLHTRGQLSISPYWSWHASQQPAPQGCIHKMRALGKVAAVFLLLLQACSNLSGPRLT